ncbi:MAG: hypothetical protein MJ134_01830 [Lachnospiraceae bacterium]|nr:hypothetical protein [Lachnospiraceae bacterium]
MKGMRKWKRFLAMLLVALMVSTLVPVDALAMEEEIPPELAAIIAQAHEEELERQRQAQAAALEAAKAAGEFVDLSEEPSLDVSKEEAGLIGEILDKYFSDYEEPELEEDQYEYTTVHYTCVDYLDPETGEEYPFVVGCDYAEVGEEVPIAINPEVWEMIEAAGEVKLVPTIVDVTAPNGTINTANNTIAGKRNIYFFFYRDRSGESNTDDTPSKKTKTITIHTKGSGEYVYDGTVHRAGDIDVLDQVIDGRNYRVTGVEAVPVNAQDVGTYVSSFVYSDKGIKVFDVTEDFTGTKYEVTDQFEVILEPSTIVITPRPVEITSCDASKVYDGAVFADKDYQKYTVVKGSIIERDNIQMVFAGSPYAYVGEYENTFSAYSKNEKALENYSFTYNFGKLTIKPSPVTIVSEDAKKVFDGKKFDDNDYQKYTIDGKIAVKDDVQIVFAESPYEVNTYENKFEIYIEDEAARKNYEFTTKFGTLTISAAESKPVVDPINPTPTPNPGPTGGGGGTDAPVTTETETTPVFPTITNAPVAPTVVNALTNTTPVVAAVANNDQFPMLVVEEPEAPENDPAPAAPAVVQIADEETPLANVLLDHDHLDCILHLLLMLGAIVIFGVYTHNHKKLQSEIQELEEAIEGRKSGKITSARKHVA